MYYVSSFSIIKKRGGGKKLEITSRFRLTSVTSFRRSEQKARVSSAIFEGPRTGDVEFSERSIRVSINPSVKLERKMNHIKSLTYSTRIY